MCRQIVASLGLMLISTASHNWRVTHTPWPWPAPGAGLLEGAPATATTKAAAADPVVGAVLSGMDPQQVIVAGGGALLADSNGYPWNGRYIVASGNLLADFHANAAAEAQGRLQTARLYNMTDDTGVRNMLKFNLARDTLHQNLWLKAIEELAGRRPGDHGRPKRAVR